MEKPTAYRDLISSLHPKYVKSLPASLEGLVDKFCSAPLLSQLTSASREIWYLLGWHNRVGVLKVDKRVHPESKLLIYTANDGRRVKLFHSEILSVRIPTQLGVSVSVAEILMWVDSEFPLTLDPQHQVLNPAGLNLLERKGGALLLYQPLAAKAEKETVAVQNEELINLKEAILQKYAELLPLSPTEILEVEGVDHGEWAMAKAVESGFASDYIWEHFAYLDVDREALLSEPEPKFETSPFVGFKNNLKA